MKPVVARWVVALLLGCGVLRAANVTQPTPDGYGSIYFIIGDSNSIICEKNVSGSQRELLCFNAQGGAVRWRQPIGGYTRAASLEEPGFAYTISGDTLSKRRLENGRIIWSTKLDRIPAQTSPPILTAREQLSQTMDRVTARFRSNSSSPAPGTSNPPQKEPTPDYYAYSLCADGLHIFIGREANSPKHCLPDWLVFDCAEGRLVNGGDGTFVGRAGNACIVIGQNPRLVVNGVASRTPDIDETGRGFGILGYPSSLKERILFRTVYFSDKVEHDVEHICIMNKSGDFVLDLKRPYNNDLPSEWFLMETNMVRIVSGSEDALELFDLSGRFLKQLSLSSLGIKPLPAYGILGRTSKSDVVFSGWKETIVLDVPSLSVKSRHQIDESDNADRRHLPGTDWICELAGGASLYDMATPEVELPLKVRLVNVYSNQALWEYTETITIRKRKPEQVTTK